MDENAIKGADRNRGKWKKDATIFLTSQTLSLFGSSLVQYAIVWYITLNTKSGVMATISIIFGFVPTFLISPFAGVLADRFNRKTLIIVADAFIAAVTLLLAIAFLLGHGSIWLLQWMLALRAVGTGIQTPAIGAFMPQIVPENKLTRINGINSSLQSTVMLVSPMISGALLALASMETIFFIDVITAGAAILALAGFLRIPAHARAQSRQEVSFFRDMAQGGSYIWGHPFIRAFFGFNILFFFLITPVAFLTPLQVVRSFGDDVWRLTAIEVAFSLGMTLGGLVMASWGGFRNRAHTMAFAGFIYSICIVALGLVPNFWGYLAVMVIIGVPLPFFQTAATVMLQEKVEGDYLGRVFGVYGMISTSMMPLGMLVFGPVSDKLPIEWLLVGSGIIMFFLCFYIIGSKELLEAGKPTSQTNAHAKPGH